MATTAPAEIDIRPASGKDILPIRGVLDRISRFISWLDRYGETSYDFQTVYASPIGRAAKSLYYRNRKLGTLAVAPMVFCEAFVPSARRLFWKPQRFPIADAHYAMGFACLAECGGQERWLDRARHFLSVLVDTRCPGLKDYAWGYPFSWVTIDGTLTTGTALITTTPYVYEAFSQVYALDRDPRWLEIMESIARHAYNDYRQLATGPHAESTGYTPSPTDTCLVVNASAYRACLLARAGIELSEPKYLEAAERNIRFVASVQNQDGSWPYAADGRRCFVDHFHTCFVMKSLTKAMRYIGSAEAEQAIERGVAYYCSHLFDELGLPRPFARAPRMITYRRELYDYAECINIAVLLCDRFPQLHSILARVVEDLTTRWQRLDGSFRSRQLLVGWDNVTMHRWAQAQLFRSLCLLLLRSAEGKDRPEMKA